MRKLLTAIAVATLAVLMWGGPVSAATIPCASGQDQTWDLVHPIGQTADVFTMDHQGPNGIIAARGVGGNNQAWVLHFTASGSSPTTTGSWINLGGATNHAVKASVDFLPGATNVLAPSIRVKGTDGNTYIRHYYPGYGWGPWVAHSVGDYWWSISYSTSAQWYSGIYNMQMRVTQALTYAYTQCSRWG